MSKFKVGDKVRVLAKPTDPYFSNEGYFKVGEVFTIKEVFDRQETVALVEKGQCWNESRFELVEEAKPTVEPQLPGVPEGFRAVRIGTPKKGEWYVGGCDNAKQCDGWQTVGGYVILEKIEQSTPVEPAKPEAPVMPNFKKGDKIKCLRSGYGFTKGNIYTLLNDFDSGKRLVLIDDDGDTQHRSWNTDHPEFELVPESPNDLVIQDRVPSRAGIDFGWWVSPEEFDRFQPVFAHAWGVGIGYRDGLMHGYKHEAGPDRLAVMCYRKDLPELPTVERVVLDEYLVWDTDGPKCLLWSTSNPTIETDSLGAWDHAYPTGNTREIEVPIVKP